MHPRPSSFLGCSRSVSSPARCCTAAAEEKRARRKKGERGAAGWPVSVQPPPIDSLVLGLPPKQSSRAPDIVADDRRRDRRIERLRGAIAGNGHATSHGPEDRFRESAAF